jgi:SnoaL-like domain
VKSFRDAIEAAVDGGDIEALSQLLSPNVVFRSPVVHKPYEGREATMMLLRAVVQVFEDFRYVAEAAGDDVRCYVFEARVGDRKLQGVDLVRYDAAGLVTELTVMVRPASGLTALGEAMREKLSQLLPGGLPS